MLKVICYSNSNNRTIRKHLKLYTVERKNIDNEQKSCEGRNSNCNEFVIFTRLLHYMLDFHAIQVSTKYLCKELFISPH